MTTKVGRAKRAAIAARVAAARAEKSAPAAGDKWAVLKASMGADFDQAFRVGEDGQFKLNKGWRWSSGHPVKAKGK